MADPIDRPGGYRQFNTNEVVTSDDLNDIGKMALQSLFDAVLSRMFRWETDSSGAAAHGGFFAGDDFAPSGTGALQTTVSAGRGIVFDDSDSDEFGPVYRPIVLQADETLEHVTYEADPRIDLVVAFPAYEPDEAASVLVYDTVSESADPDTVNTRARVSCTLQIVKGTAAASPSAPSVPAGAIKIAQVTVPATSGSILVEDHRPLLQLAQSLGIPQLLGIVTDVWHLPFVPGSDSSSDLQVTQTGPASMAVLVAPGRALANGRWHQVYQDTTVSIAAADPTNPRIDTVYLDSDGAPQARTGTPAATPASPGFLAGETPLATVAVAALATSIPGSAITDARRSRPFPGGSIEEATIPGDADTVVDVYPDPTNGVQTALGPDQYIDVTIQLKDRDGNAISEERALLIEIFKSDGQRFSGSETIELLPAPSHPGGVYKSLGSNSYERIALTTDENGVAVFEVVDVGGATLPVTVFYKVTPLAAPGHPSMDSMAFA